MTSAQINAFIRKNHRKLDDAVIAKRCGLSKNAVQHRRGRMGLKGKEKEFKPIETEVEEYVTHKRDKIEEARFKRLLEAHERLQRAFQAKTTLMSSSPQTHVIRPHKGSGGEATIVALLSDTHLEETVKPENTNGLGKYNLTIAEQRFDQYFRVLLHLIELEQKNTRIDTLVLALLGDYISGDIHDELLETCSLQPMQAVIKAQDWIASGIDYLLKNSKLTIILVCHSGNHARTTKKTRHTTEPGHSLEFLMYNNLRQLYRHEKRTTWIVPESYLSYVDIYDTKIAFHHGHNVKYAGGVGGITISMNKAIAQWNRSQRADIYCCGHFHSVFDGGQFVVNGSMIGYNAFAVAIKAAYERPAQIIFAIHSKLGKYMTRNIYFDE
jgi:hypothetical protein